MVYLNFIITKGVKSSLIEVSKVWVTPRVTGLSIVMGEQSMGDAEGDRIK